MAHMNKRQSELLQIIKDHGTISVNDLVPRFTVSPATLRKDLTFLQDMGLVVRSRGEVHISEKSAITPFESRQNLNSEFKAAIARVAAQQIEEGDTIILDSGSTTAEIARLLVNRNNLSVITNSLPVALTLANTRVEVYLAGGVLLRQNISTQGPEAENYFNRIEVNKAFISASGVLRDVGLAASTPFEETVKRSMIHAAKTVYAVLDSTKFNRGSLNLFAGFEEIDTIITNAPIENPSLRERFAQLKLTCLVAE